MATHNITVTNNAVGCNNEIEQQLSVTGCSTYIVRLTTNSNALGPFNVYLDSSIYYSAQTRTQMLDGVVTNFNITIEELDYVIAARQDQKISKVDNRCYDYTDVVNYDENLKFDEHIHQQYLNHLEIETVDGLTVHDIVEWFPGDVIVFERSRLHCASSCHSEKIGITIFVH